MALSKAWPSPWQPGQTSKTSSLAGPRLPELRGTLDPLSRTSEHLQDWLYHQSRLADKGQPDMDKPCR